MKREKQKDFYCFLAMITFMVCYLITFILSHKTMQIGKITALSGAIIYPVTYFISILFYERYGKKNTLLMITYTVFALIIAGVLLLIMSLIFADSNIAIFNLSFNSMVASIAGFVIGQVLNIYIYNYLEEKNGFSFLISAVIAITIDSLIFVGLGFIGVHSFDEIIKLFTGQYIISIVLVLFYALCFAYLAPAFKKMHKRVTCDCSPNCNCGDNCDCGDDCKCGDDCDCKNKKEEVKEIKPASTKATVKKTDKKEPAKKTTTKKAAAKKTTTKKTATKKTATKKSE